MSLRIRPRALLSGALLLAACSTARPPLPPIPEVEALPDPVRFESDITAFEQADRAAMPRPGAVLFVGSSSMRMWHERLASDLEPLTVIGRGFGGSTWLDLIHYVDRIVTPYQPRAVVLYEGDNDIDYGATAEETYALYEAAIARIRRALPDARLYIFSTKPCPARWDHWSEIEKLNRMVRASCEADDSLWYVDVATPMLDATGRPRAEIFLPDGIHMNERGYEIWTAATRPVVVRNEERHER